MTAPAGIMYDSNIRTDKPFIPGQGKPSAQIDILVVEKIALIKAAELFKYRSGKKHEHACNPVGTGNGMSVGPYGGLSTCNLLHELPRGGKSALTVFPLTGIVNHPRRYNPNIVLTSKFEKSRKGVHGQTDVWVEDAKKIAFNEFECCIVVCAKTTGSIIGYNMDGKVISLKREISLFMDIGRENNG
jgi:hypothetical protein